MELPVHWEKCRYQLVWVNSGGGEWYDKFHIAGASNIIGGGGGGKG